MKLVKDLVEDRIVFYWTADDLRISPLLPNFEQAEEWYIKFMHDNYVGEERRNSHIDRRKLYTSRDRARNTEILPTNPIGRRGTDRSVKVDIDLSKEKLSKLVELHKQFEEIDRNHKKDD